jgi:hypothetical protein
VVAVSVEVEPSTATSTERSMVVSRPSWPRSVASASATLIPCRPDSIPRPDQDCLKM